MIEVILLERIERLGQMGQVVKVRPGFARNFLLPQNKALRATKANVELFEKQRVELEAKNATERTAAEARGKKLAGLSFTVIRQASDAGQLYGSVAARDIAEAAKEAGQDIPRSNVMIDAPIKTLGIFPIKVKLHAEVSIKISVNVARSTEEAVMQKEKAASANKKSQEKAEVIEAFGAPAEAEDTEEGAPKKKAAKKAAKAKADDAEDGTAEAKEEAAPKAKKAAKAKKAE